jgi:DNA-binding transcriptional ArsR family regulator
MTLKEVFHPAAEQLNLSIVLDALSDPVRLRIMKRLSESSEASCSCCNYLPKSALSHHFKVLREAGLINVRIEGKQRFLSIRYEELQQRFPGLLEAVLRSVEPAGEPQSNR